MKKHAILYSGLVLLLAGSVFAQTYKSEHFIFYTDLDPRFVQFLKANAEAFYSNLEGKYFRTGWQKPLEVYYSKTHSDTFKLLCKHGHKKEGSNVQARNSYYILSTQSIYTHQYLSNGTPLGWGVLFHEIAHHFVRLNYKDVPAWFNEGLACFFGDETRIVKGKVTLGVPNPWRESRLKEQIERGIRPNLTRLFSTTDEQLYKWPIGYHFSRALFYQLHEDGKLQEYLQNALRDGYRLKVLEKTVHKPVNEINKDLLDFIKRDCYAGAYLYEGWQLEDNRKRGQTFLKALELKPDYARAQLSLAQCYYLDKNYKQCREYLEWILKDPASTECLPAAELMGDRLSEEGNYAKALEYYQKTLEYADYDEHKYNLYYWIGRCYHHMKDYQLAKKFYKMFLDNNWEPQRWPKRVEYATKYQNRDEVKEAREKSEDKQESK